jgi:hypothetical protein
MRWLKYDGGVGGISDRCSTEQLSIKLPINKKEEIFSNDISLKIVMYGLVPRLRLFLGKDP